MGGSVFKIEKIKSKKRVVDGNRITPSMFGNETLSSPTSYSVTKPKVE